MTNLGHADESGMANLDHADESGMANLDHADENGMRRFLFTRKNNEGRDDGVELYFLGETYPTGPFHRIAMQETTASVPRGAYPAREHAKHRLACA